jgi:CRISPR-associated endonuclease Cas1
MFTNKDLEFRSIYVINCIESRDLRVSNGELLLEQTDDKKILTKLPFQKILALFVIGHIRITTPLIEKCKENNVALIVTKTSLRPVFYWSNTAEANFLVRKRQYALQEDDLTIARRLVENKIRNHIALLVRTRRKDEKTSRAIQFCNLALSEGIGASNTLSELMSLEGRVAKLYFNAYFQDYDWKGRGPRVKCDFLNTTLDIGYTHLFNFIECFVRMFGFDVYVGVYHRLWFKRKSLVCDLVEPFRCIIDNTVRTGINRGQIKLNHFELYKGEWRLKRECNKDYNKLFFDALIPHKKEIFKYVQQYYRAFMRQKGTNDYPLFEL